MVVGVMRITLRIPENNSLKGKRRVVKQILERTRSRFRLAVAETGLNDVYQAAEIGLACVGNDGRVCNSVLDQAADFIESIGTALVTGRELEILHF
ncbi:MAG: DUF503 domain-containing protein [Deltaproteobacteria bacterium]|nr:MAG: DUF503 domain-containing protein [Deltaproteobacteria bacterium]